MQLTVPRYHCCGSATSSASLCHDHDSVSSHRSHCLAVVLSRWYEKTHHKPSKTSSRHNFPRFFYGLARFTQRTAVRKCPARFNALPHPTTTIAQRGTSTTRSFFSTGPDPPRTPADVSWIREQAGGTPRTLDREFVEANAIGGQNNGNARAASSTNSSSSGTTANAGRGKTYNRRTWTKEENEQLQQGISSLGIPECDLGKHVSVCKIDVCWGGAVVEAV